MTANETNQQSSHGSYRRRLYLPVLPVAALICLAVTAYGGWDGEFGTTGFDPRDTAGGAALRKAADEAADLDGDGHRDSVSVSTEGDPSEGGRFSLNIDYSADGPGREKHVAFSSADLGVRPGMNQMPPHSPTLADLDRDGHPDIVFGASARVLWGSSNGPRPGDRAVRLRWSPGGDKVFAAEPLAGDFDGDGRTELVTYHQAGADGEGGNRIDVLHGPFKRDGSAARTTRRDNPLAESGDFDKIARLTVGNADGDKATDLVVHEEAEEDGAWALLTGGAKTATGFGDCEKPVMRGDTLVFDDLDGDEFLD